jgi:hypothetical protein
MKNKKEYKATRATIQEIIALGTIPSFCVKPATM